MRLTGNDGKLFHKQVTALTRDSIRLLRQEKNNGKVAQAVEARGIILEENPVTKTAILTIKSFDTALVQAMYKQSFQPVIDSVFMQLKSQGIQNLLLDLRDNQGGDFEPGRHLLSYLITTSTAYLLSGKEAKLLQPQNNHFSGSLFVLINGGSFSNSAIVSACLEGRKQTTFIGEESGGNKFLIFGEATDVVLPHTKIQAYIATDSFRINQQSGDHGIIPKHVVQPTITDLLSGNDRAKALALQLMTGQKK
jgi:C-terminal processing protease CtpA/Prc